MPKAIWITWEKQIRNKSLSTRLGAELHIVLSKRKRLARYAVCSFRSLLLIWKHRPSVVFVQNPSIVLTCLLMLLKHLFNYTYVIDAHYAGIEAANGKRLLQYILDFCNRRADLVIVTNEMHRKCVEAVGGRALVCEDPLPDIGDYARAECAESKNVFFICSFDVDEPYADVFNAASILQQEGYVFWVSGNFRKAGITASDWPQVRFLGYVSEPEFYERLARSQVVVDVTTMENCLLCGAYEAMALKKPLVTSNTSALRNYFTSGAVFVDHSPESIAAGIRAAYSGRVEFGIQIGNWSERAIADNVRKIEAIRRQLNLPDWNCDKK